MNSFFTMPWLFLAVPFALAAVMPNGRWLAGYALLAVFVGIQGLFLSSKDSGNSPGYAIGLLFVMLALFSFVVSVAAKWISLELRGAGRIRSSYAALAIGAVVVHAPYLWMMHSIIARQLRLSFAD
jgi:hypothetical protein